jgi:transcriptional regulator with XRE-family HTH domain
MDDFGRYLRRLRQERDLTLKQVELASGVSNAYISQLERGRRKSPHPDILKGLAKAYGVPVEDLLRAAGYLGETSSELGSRERLEQGYQRATSDPQFQHGTRLRGTRLSLEAKRFIVEMYERVTGQRIL